MKFTGYLNSTFIVLALNSEKSLHGRAVRAGLFFGGAAAEFTAISTTRDTYTCAVSHTLY